jgi:hypothetical protein
MKYKDRARKDVSVPNGTKCVLDNDTNTVTFISVQGMTTIPILTMGMSKEEGVFCILDFYDYE